MPPPRSTPPPTPRRCAASRSSRCRASRATARSRSCSTIERRVHQVRLHIVEFRGFERFIQGRPYWEVPVMVQRLCGICPVSHHLAASKALDGGRRGASRRRPTSDPPADALRPDPAVARAALLSTWRRRTCSSASTATRRKRNVVGVLAAHPDIARQGVLLRKFGQEVIRVTAGKRVHGTGSIPGGVNKRDHRRRARRAARRCRTSWPGRRPACGWWPLHRPDRRCTSSSARCAPACCRWWADGKLDLYDGVLRARDADGAIIFDQRRAEGLRRAHPPRERALVELHEVPVHRALGPEDGWYKVGPLARIQNCDFDRHAAGRGRAPGASWPRLAGGVQFTRRWRTTGRG
jgi:NAD-reducing hydrogenase large subunit